MSEEKKKNSTQRKETNFLTEQKVYTRKNTEASKPKQKESEKRKQKKNSTSL